MLRVFFGPNERSSWELSEDELLSRVDGLANVSFAGAPAGRVSVEAVDELGRVKWCAYYPGAADLAILARQIRQARAALARRRAEGRP
jgi:hypothetical protein